MNKTSCDVLTYTTACTHRFGILDTWPACRDRTFDPVHKDTHSGTVVIRQALFLCHVTSGKQLHRQGLPVSTLRLEEKFPPTNTVGVINKMMWLTFVIDTFSLSVISLLYAMLILWNFWQTTIPTHHRQTCKNVTHTICSVLINVSTVWQKTKL